MESRIEKLEARINELEKQLSLKKNKVRGGKEFQNTRSQSVSFKVINDSQDGSTLYIRVSRKWIKLFSFSDTQLTFGKNATFKRDVKAQKGSIFVGGGDKRGLVIPTVKPVSPVRGSMCVNPADADEVIQYNGTTWKVMDGNTPT